MSRGPTPDMPNPTGYESSAVHPKRKRAGRPSLSMMAGLALAAALLASCGGSAPAQPPAGEGIVQNRPVPNIPLISANGQATSEAAFKGKYVVMASFLTLCQDECPLVTGAFITMQRDVRAAGLGNQVAFAEVTVDPTRDTPGSVAGLLVRIRRGLAVADRHASQPARALGVHRISYQVVPEEQPAKIDWYTGKPLTYDVDHTDGYILLDRQGHERFVDINAPNLHGSLPKGLTGLLNAGGLNNLRHPNAQTWTVDQALAALSWLVGKNIPVATG